MSSFFIARPIFAIVLAIVTCLAGAVGIYSLPISQYPEVAPTTITIQAAYSGATAEAVENSVTTVIESAMTGFSDLLYMESSSSTGSASVTLTFGNAIDADIAQVQVQNKLALVESNLPDVVQQAGLTVNRSGSSILMVGNIISKDGRYTSSELAEITSTTIEPVVEQVEGVGSISSFGSGYAMRIWLDPLSLAQYSLTPSDITAAIQQQNVQVSVGALGSSPTTAGQQLRATMTAQSQLQTVAEFENIILVSGSDGGTVRLSDVARVELGLESYGQESSYSGVASAGFGVQLASGANAINTANGVHAALDRLANTLPEGVEVVYSYETTPFVELSIEKVIYTLIEAIALVFVVLLVFLQNWRATLIPMIAVPVVMLGTFGVLAMFGYSINTLTMFAMVLAIGLLVDDAIVVVENVERIMSEEHISAREATEKSMDEILGAVIGIAAVLTAVFLPMAFFSGSVGVIYRQFSVTIASAMILSAVVAIVLTPALCVLMLKPHDPDRPRRFNLFGWFNTGFANLTGGYVGAVGQVIRRPFVVLVVFAGLLGGAYWLYTQLPTSFLPEEDQGVLLTIITLPDGATAARTQAAMDIVENYYLTQETDAVESVFMILGFSVGGGGGENSAMAFVRLKDFDQRKQDRLSASAISQRALMYFSQIRDAQVFALAPPAIQGLGTSNGFEMVLLDQANNGPEALGEASNELARLAGQTSEVTNVRGNTGDLNSQLKVVIDQEKAGALGIDLSAANAVLSVAFAGANVNDFIYNGEIKPVMVQGDAQYRRQPDDIKSWFAKNRDGEMVPFSSFATTQWVQGSASLARFNSTPSVSMSGNNAPGVSSGAAMDKMEELVAGMDGGYGVAWEGLSYQERLSGSQAILLYAVSILVVFLCLAALYESWSIPFSVILALPVGVAGALLAAYLFGQSNDVYFQVGLLTTMGLSAKNAILIVEFARDLRAQGMSVIEAITGAARMRLRPIVMTSLAFLLGVIPLATSSGAGSGAQNAIGIGVVGGTLAGTLLGIFFVPVFFVLIGRAWSKA
ncbi:efflux RND transporter permease subunit [uncultured Devosia sp.]|uniref:efflux RND transporter permease subunit n=1 Tax=uncultured Devosia sp. TaxID=211434 RepID=UPI0035C95CAC